MRERYWRAWRSRSPSTGDSRSQSAAPVPGPALNFGAWNATLVRRSRTPRVRPGVKRPIVHYI